MKHYDPHCPHQRLRDTSDYLLTLALCWMLIANILLFGVPFILSFSLPGWIIMIPVGVSVALVGVGELLFRVATSD